MSDDERDDAIAARARALLDQSVEELDPITRARLRAARMRALDVDATVRLRARRLAVAGAGALGLLAALSWWMRGANGPRALAEGFEDEEILAAGDDLELYDDLDFYRWLEEDGAI